MALTIYLSIHISPVLLSNQIVSNDKCANHSVNSSSHCVNGDIAIQWEWSNFDHS